MEFLFWTVLLSSSLNQMNRLNTSPFASIPGKHGPFRKQQKTKTESPLCSRFIAFVKILQLCVFFSEHTPHSSQESQLRGCASVPEIIFFLCFPFFFPFFGLFRPSCPANSPFSTYCHNRSVKQHFQHVRPEIGWVGVGLCQVSVEREGGRKNCPGPEWPGAIISAGAGRGWRGVGLSVEK